YMPLGALKMTTQKFYRVSGDSTQYRGVVPDIILPDRSRYNEYGERYLDYSLPWDAIEAVEHKDWPPVDRAGLNAKSQERVAVNEDFIEIQRVAEAMGERIKNTRQSLLIEDVVRQRDELQGMDASPHGMVDNEEEDSDDSEGEDSEEEQDPTEKLIESVLDDTYAKESMAILADMAAQQTAVAENKQK
ncbi:MAG: tail-specific protease, partial [Deltaproteobacteria bacterium]